MNIFSIHKDVYKFSIQGIYKTDIIVQSNNIKMIKDVRIKKQPEIDIDYFLEA